ncbi:sialidase-3-like isoform X1 [Patiria miniata]|uniref:Sialidase domain-containing protein n=2 Tax=Patiria miniata TaxID=46514 RepID=A0A913ZAA9_PATMI|nr:sialidase-3-like isoform X1 [Patiria miniata]
MEADKRLDVKAPPLTEIFGQGDHGYNTFRIPAIVYNRRTLLAFCEARKSSFRDWGSMDLVLRRGILKDDEVIWGDIQVIASMPEYRTMNPVPIVNKRTNSIVLVFVAFPQDLSEADLIKGQEYQQKVLVTKSRDNGLTWSEPRDVSETTLGMMDPRPHIYASGPGHGIQLTSGRLVVPGSVFWKPPHETGFLSEIKHKILEFFDCFYNAQSRSMVIYSDDGGETWEQGGGVPAAFDQEGQLVNANECQIVEFDDGRAYINSRTLGVQTPRQQAFSQDGCLTFNPGELATQLPEPGHTLTKWIPSVRNFGGCQASILGFRAPSSVPPDAYDMTSWVLFSNPASTETRVNMSVRLSRNGCRTWSAPWQLNSGASAYSDLVGYETRTSDRVPVLNFACLYECGSLHPYERIVFQTFTLEKMMQGVGMETKAEPTQDIPESALET